jgi:type I restriction enzyme M protein
MPPSPCPPAPASPTCNFKGKDSIGEDINKKIIEPIIKTNEQLSKSDFPDFNNSVKHGDSREKIERLSNPITIFENPALDFSKNRAGGAR